MDFPHMIPDKGANGKSGGASGDFQDPHPLLTFADFMETFTCPIYVIDGILQRGRLHALTSPTGHGKTAVALMKTCYIAAGRHLGNIEVTQGNVVFLAGENPDDLAGRCWAACQHYDLGHDLPIHVLPGNFPLNAAAVEALKQKIDALDIPITAIFGDSAAAYFPGEDDNQNVQMGDYARIIRRLTECNGNPAVTMLCHPVKNAAKDNLIPRGGSAFINELDANLTLWAEGQRETTTLHWQGKIRGVDFAPVTFELSPVTLVDKVDRKGRHFVSVVSTPMTEAEVEATHHQATLDRRTVLEHLRRTPGISMNQIATTVRWLNSKQTPNKRKVQLIIEKLAEHKLVEKTLDNTVWKITKAGENILKGGS